ncbi:MAG: amino acid racemase [Candidatus Aminicenantes bacterium]|nr:amino acid racemase [Candidatus Aminicenantes bacterium]
MTKTIGILGGMGPEATEYMFDLILKNTKAEEDQDHIPVLIYSNPKIPHRTNAIFKKGPSPTPLLIKGIKKLIQAGADFIIIPCVTAHYFLPEVAQTVDFSYLSLLEESLHWAKDHIPGLKKAGLISSTGTLQSGLFHKTYEKAGVQVIGPEESEQEKVMQAIYGPSGIKAGFTKGLSKEWIVNTAKILIGRGAEAIIAGCTEIPLVLKPEDIAVPLIEPMQIVAQASILKAGYELR